MSTNVISTQQKVEKAFLTALKYYRGLTMASNNKKLEKDSDYLR